MGKSWIAIVAALGFWVGCPDSVVSLDPLGDDDTAYPDHDGDGFTIPDGDCDDNDAAVNPDAEEIPYDGIDNDCDDQDLTDVDGDGHDSDAVDGGDDCDDNDDTIHPGASELCDGVDHDCDGVDHDDDDADGFDVCDDCDDDDPLTYPGADEVCDGIDNDCGGSLPLDEQDSDDDGYSTCAGDCDDDDATANPGEAEIPYDGIDNNCSEGDFTDVDGDDHDWEGMADGDDCDDNDASVYPGAAEFNGDGVDSNCDGLDDIPLGDYCYHDDSTMPVPGLAQYSLSWSDGLDGPAGANHYYDDIEFEAEAGWNVTITMWEEGWLLDPYLYLLDINCQVIAEDDNSYQAGYDDAWLEIEILTAGVYTIIATSAGEWQSGNYEIWIE